MSSDYIEKLRQERVTAWAQLRELDEDYRRRRQELEEKLETIEARTEKALAQALRREDADKAKRVSLGELQRFAEDKGYDGRITTRAWGAIISDALETYLSSRDPLAVRSHDAYYASLNYVLRAAAQLAPQQIPNYGAKAHQLLTEWVLHLQEHSVG